MWQQNQDDPVLYEDVVTFLLSSFPEIEAAYAKELEWWGSDEPGSTIVYEDLFVPLIKRLISIDKEAEVRRVSTFLERLATAGDDRVRDILLVAVLEPLSGEPETLVRLRPRMGPVTRRMLKKVQSG
jgi:hypothetical protein